MSISLIPNVQTVTPSFTGRNPAFDAFNRLRVSEPKSLFEASFQFDKQPYLFDEIETGTGTSTFTTNANYIALGVTNAGTGRVVRQSKEYVKYQPGKSKLILFTGVMEAIAGGASGVTCRIGTFDDAADKTVDAGGDGVFFQLDGTEASVVVRSFTTGSQVDNVITQDNWNLDKMDGTGPSGITIDWSVTQIFVIDIEWLGVGSVRFGFVVDGLIHYCHHQHHANKTLNKPYMQSATLPIRYEISGDGTNNGTMHQICTAVLSEGGFTPVGPTFLGRRTGVTVSTTFTPILAVRPDIVRVRGYLTPISVALTPTSTGETVEWALIHAPDTLTGGTFSDFSVNSMAEINTGVTAYTGGSFISSSFASSGNANNGSTPSLHNLFSTNKARANIAGEAESLLLVARAISGTADVDASMQWQEVY